MTMATVQEIPVEKIKPSPHQARKDFDLDALKSLAESIKEHDLQQPINVRQVGDGYELVAGERRLRAVKLLGLPAIQAIVLNVDDTGEAAVRGLIENLQREDLNPIEEAQGYAKLQKADPKKWTQEEIGRVFGGGQAYVSETLRLLSLPVEVQESISHEILSRSHAEPLLRLTTPEQQLEIGQKAANERWSSTKTEQEVKKTVGSKGKRNKNESGSQKGGGQAIQPDPLEKVWGEAKHALNGQLAVYWEATFGPKKIEGMKGITLNGWTFTVNPVDQETPEKDLAKWLYQLSQLVGKQAGTDPAKTTVEEMIALNQSIAKTFTDPETQKHLKAVYEDAQERERQAQAVAHSEPTPVAEPAKKPLDPKIAEMIARQVAKGRITR